MHCDFDCDVHFPDLAPFGLPLNSADKSLEGLKTDFLLVKVEDTDVQVLSYFKFLFRRSAHYSTPQADQVFSENGIKFTFHVFQLVK